MTQWVKFCLYLVWSVEDHHYSFWDSSSFFLFITSKITNMNKNGVLLVSHERVLIVYLHNGC